MRVTVTRLQPNSSLVIRLHNGWSQPIGDDYLNLELILRAFDWTAIWWPLKCVHHSCDEIIVKMKAFAEDIDTIATIEDNTHHTLTADTNESKEIIVKKMIAFCVSSCVDQRLSSVSTQLQTLTAESIHRTNTLQDYHFTKAICESKETQVNCSANGVLSCDDYTLKTKTQLYSNGSAVKTHVKQDITQSPHVTTHVNKCVTNGLNGSTATKLVTNTSSKHIVLTNGFNGSDSHSSVNKCVPKTCSAEHVVCNGSQVTNGSLEKTPCAEKRSALTMKSIIGSNGDLKEPEVVTIGDSDDDEPDSKISRH